MGAPPFQRNGKQMRLINAYIPAWASAGEIVAYGGDHPATGSRRLKQAEQGDVRSQDLTPIVELILRHSS